MSKQFNYQNKENVILPNPMSTDKSVIRTTLIPSLLNIYNYNKTRKQDNIMIYEISKVYDKDYNEDTMITLLMKGNYIENSWNHNAIKVDFYLLKGIVEDILDYLGLKNRYNFELDNLPSMHSSMSCKITLDKKDVGILGRVHPLISKDDIYVAELSLNKLIKPVKPIKYKEANKYPEIVKDVAFVVNKNTPSLDIYNVIKRAGSRLLTSVEVFDLYVGENVNENEKSLAYKLTFADSTRTLNEEEVMTLFENIISEVCSKCNAKLRG